MTEPAQVLDIQKQLKELTADMAEVTNGSDPSAPVETERLLGILEQMLVFFNVLGSKIAEQEQQIQTLLKAASQERMDRLERRQDALIDQVEEVDDKIDAHEAEEEMRRTGEKPIPLAEIERELDAQ